MSELRSKKLGHDLSAILKRTNALGLASVRAVSASEEAEILKANKYYKSKGFGYFGAEDALRGYSNRPDREVIATLCDELLDQLLPLCKTFTP